MHRHIEQNVHVHYIGQISILTYCIDEICTRINDYGNMEFRLVVQSNRKFNNNN